MKKKILSAALILCLLLFGCQTAAPAESGSETGAPTETAADAAVGYSLEDAGITLTMPFEQTAKPVLSDDDPEDCVSIAYEQYRFPADAPHPFCDQYTLNSTGSLTELVLSWKENVEGDPKPPQAHAVLAVYQAFRKSDLADGKVIFMKLVEKSNDRKATEEDLGFSIVKLTEETVKDSELYAGETEDYYIINWRCFLGGGNDSTYAIRTAAATFINDGYYLDRPLTQQYISTIKAMLLLVNTITFAQ